MELKMGLIIISCNSLLRDQFEINFERLLIPPEIIISQPYLRTNKIFKETPKYIWPHCKAL